MSAISPTHDPITYQWSSDCTDSTFTATDAAQTGWSKPSQGACRIEVVATSNDYSIKQSFMIVVFSGADGATTVDGVFVRAPRVLLDLDGFNAQMNPQECATGSFVSVGNNSCSITVSAPDLVGFLMRLSPRGSESGWGQNSTPGNVTLSDDCGGHFAVTFRAGDETGGAWMPPAAGGLCILTARAINGDGISASAPVAVLTRPGSIPDTRPPEVFASLGTCRFTSSQPNTPMDCGGVAANSHVDFSAFAHFPDSRGGVLTATDDCGGGQFQFSNQDFLGGWTASGAPGSNCHLTVTATNLEGVTTTTSALYRLF